MTMKTRLLAISLLFGILPIVVMLAAANQAGLGLSRDIQNMMAIALMITILTCLLTPGIICYWLFSNQVKQIKEFCQKVKAGQYDAFLDVPSERGGEGKENELVDLMRDMNWMVHRIKVNEIELKQAVTNLTQSKAEIQLQKLELEKVNAEQLVIHQQLQGRTRELTEAVTKIRNLLDNTGQGFLSFGEDLKVAGEYSAECVIIFNQEISAKWVPELIYPEDTSQQTFLEALFKKIFEEDDAFLRETYFSLLPEELIFDGSNIRIEYKYITRLDDPERREILLVLTDITEQREMEKKIQNEKNVLAMVVKAVTHYQEFNKAIGEYELFCREELPELIFSQEPVHQKINAIFCAIHTWKGTFGQLGMLRLAANLHEVESALAALRDETKECIEQSELITCFTAYSPELLHNWLKGELVQLQEILGDRFFTGDEAIIVENYRLRQLEDKIQRLLNPCQARELITELRQLRYKPFSDLLNMYPDYLANVAINQGKEINSLQITGSKVLVDPERYHDFAKSLVHVFRNAIAHGLETPEERLVAGKEIQGQISCNIEDAGGNLVVTIGDDGRGMDADFIRKLAVTKGLCSEEKAGGLSNEESVQLIFADGFSSAGFANELAGRGVGLSAVKKEVEKLDGHIEIFTEQGKGTKFTFVLPLVGSKATDSFDVLYFGEQVLSQAKTLLQGHFALQSEEVDNERNTDIVSMRNISTFIDIKGVFSGRFMVSADEDLVKHMADGYLHNLEFQEYDKLWLESALAEFFNTTIGNALQLVPDWQELDIGTPVTIWAKGASAKYKGADVISWKLTTKLGELYLSLISFMRKDGDTSGACTGC